MPAFKDGPAPGRTASTAVAEADVNPLLAPWTGPFGGAIITPAAPRSMTSRVSARMGAKPGAETPTITGFLNRARTRFTMPTDSSCDIFGASPSWPSTVMPSMPASM